MSSLPRTLDGPTGASFALLCGMMAMVTSLLCPAGVASGIEGVSSELTPFAYLRAHGVCGSNRKGLWCRGHLMGKEDHDGLAPTALARLWRQYFAKAPHEIREISFRTVPPRVERFDEVGRLRLTT